MKYKTFRNLVLTGVVVAVGGGFFAWLQLKPDAPARPTKATPAAGAQTHGERHVAYLTETLGKPAPKDGKQKDALGKGAPKVNVYEEGGVWGRAKVDLDRDDKWDEKWDLKSGRIERRVAANDDEDYGAAQIIGGETKGSASKAAASTPKAPLPAGAIALTADEERVRARLSSSVSKKVKDLFRGQGIKVNLYADDGKRFNRAKIDLDRDEKWDEKWTIFRDGQIEKQVAPKDDENYTTRYLFKDGAWVPKK